MEDRGEQSGRVFPTSAECQAFYCARCTQFFAPHDVLRRTPLYLKFLAVFWTAMLGFVVIVSTIELFVEGLSWSGAGRLALVAVASYWTIRAWLKDKGDMEMPACPNCHGLVQSILPDVIGAFRPWPRYLVAIAGLVAGVAPFSILQWNLPAPVSLVFQITLLAIIVFLLRSRVLSFWAWFLIFGPAMILAIMMMVAVRRNGLSLVYSANDLMMLVLVPMLVGPMVGVLVAILAGTGNWLVPSAPRQDGTKCPRCGYSLLGCTSGVCPECGLDYSLACLAAESGKNDGQQRAAPPS